MIALRIEPEPKEATLKALPTYSPGRIRMMLRLMPHMHPSDSHLPLPQELEPLIHALGYKSWPSDAQSDYYGLKEALHWLWLKDERAENAVRLHYCVDMSYRAIAAALKAEGRRLGRTDCEVSHVTVSNWINDGVELMAWRMGWRRKDTALHPFKHDEQDTGS